MSSTPSTLVTSHIPPANESLSGQVVRAIQARRVQFSTLHVEADAGVVTLRGLANSFYQKQLWLHATQCVPGVLGIVDQIEVAPLPAR
ncbi:MAG: BON domain-containing protein [Pirellulaceae bacterium]